MVAWRGNRQRRVGCFYENKIFLELWLKDKLYLQPHFLFILFEDLELVFFINKVAFKFCVFKNKFAVI